MNAPDNYQPWWTSGQDELRAAAAAILARPLNEITKVIPTAYNVTITEPSGRCGGTTTRTRRIELH